MGRLPQDIGPLVVRLIAAPTLSRIGTPTAAWGMAVPPPSVTGTLVKTAQAVKTVNTKHKKTVYQIIVHNMKDLCVKNENLVSVTTSQPLTGRNRKKEV